MIISIIMPAYNAATHIAEAIDSVIAQTYPQWELWVIDDGSTDDTATIVQAYDDPRVRYVWQPNQERSAARNNGLRRATGTYLTFLDSDDYWASSFIETHVQYLEAHPTIDITVSWAHEVNEAGDIARVMRPGFSADLSCEEAWRQFLYGNRFLMLSTVLRRSIATIEFDLNLRQAEDWDYWLRLVRNHRAHTIQVPNASYRRYDVYMPQRRLKRNSAESIAYILEKALADSPPAERNDALGYAYWDIAWLNYAMGEIEQGQAYLRQAHQLAPQHFADDDAIVQRIAYFADELYDLHTPMVVATAHITRFFEQSPTELKIGRLLRPTLGFYAMLALFRANERGDWHAVRTAGHLALQKQPTVFRNRGAASLYLKSFWRR